MTEEKPYGDDDHPDTKRAEIMGLGMKIFVFSLAVFFAASVVGYLFIRLTSPAAPPSGFIELPLGLWCSTLVLLATGWTVHLAERRARYHRFAEAGRWLGITWVLGLGFIAIQTPCMVSLLRGHEILLAQKASGIYGLTFALIILHALHVLGGMIPLGLLVLRARRHALTPAQKPAIGACTLYWHFLEIVWIVLFGIFLITA